MSVDNTVTALITCMTDAERPYIENAINSVLKQKHPCKLVVLLNEESSKFDDLFAKYKKAIFIKTKIRPIGEMRNFGLHYADTKWIAYLDGDDIWYPSKIYEQLAFANQNNADLVGCDHYLISENGTPCACSISHNIPMPSSWLVKCEVMKERQFSDARLCEDGEWWVKNISHLNVVRLPYFGLGYRVRGNSLSAGTPSKRRKWLVVHYGSYPVARQLALFITWVMNRSQKSTKYKWLAAWSKT